MQSKNSGVFIPGVSVKTLKKVTIKAVEALISDGEMSNIDLPTWIPCSERLPNVGDVVLITNDKGNVRCGQYRGVLYQSDGGYVWHWKGNRGETVKAWRPLPEPWKGADDE